MTITGPTNAQINPLLTDNQHLNKNCNAKKLVKILYTINFAIIMNYNHPLYTQLTCYLFHSLDAG